MKSKPVRALLDGDIIAFKAAFACETGSDWGDGMITYHTSKDELYRLIDTIVRDWANPVKPNKVVVVLSGQGNFRKELFPDYKANRKTMRKPLGLPEALAYLRDRWKARSEDRLEADDVIGIMATDPRSKYRNIIVSIDKDMMTLPVEVYNPDKGTRARLSKKEAHLTFLKQVLTGDAVDNYKGCPDIGEKRASRILEGVASPKEGWERVTDAYVKAGLSEEDALVQARLARILHHSDYNKKKGKIKLWIP